MTPVKAADARVLVAIARAIEKDGYPPSQRELAETVARSRADVRRSLDRLADDGYIALNPSTGRGIRLLRVT